MLINIPSPDFLATAIIPIYKITKYLRSPTVNYFDLKITHKLQAINNKPIINFLNFTSWLGFTPQVFFCLALPLIILTILNKHYEALLGSVSFGLLLITISILKKLIKIPRPTSSQKITIRHHHSTSSFPSGHVTTYTFTFGYLAFLVLLSPLKFNPKMLLLLLLFTPIILVGPSRVYQGEHWTSDTISGYILGIIWLILTLLFL